MKRKAITALAVVAFIAAGGWLLQMVLYAAGWLFLMVFAN